MSSHTPPNTGPMPRIAMAILAALALGGVALLIIGKRRMPAPSKPAVMERVRAELELREGILLHGGAPFTGVVVDHYDGGELKSRSFVSNGLLEGLSLGWYSNGVLQVTETFNRGVSHGLRTKFHPSSQKLSESNVVLGQNHGTFRRWYEDGQLAEQLELTNGVAHGESIAFHPDGSIKARVRLQAGQVVDQQFWQPGEMPAANSETP